jgi:hypothetical protein
MADKKKSDKSNERVNVFAVGDRIRVNLHTGRIVKATIKAVIQEGGKGEETFCVGSGSGRLNEL